MLDYRNDMKSKYKENVGINMLLRIIKRFTKGQQIMKNFVDYCLGVLVFENMRTLEYVVNELAMDLMERKKLISEIIAVSDYLKRGYHAHLDMEEDAAHDSCLALTRECETVHAR